MGFTIRDGSGLELAERQWRHDRVRTEMGKQGFDRLLVFGPGWRRDNVRYLAGTAVRSGWFLIDVPLEGEVRAFCPALWDATRVSQAGWIRDVTQVRDPGLLRGLWTGARRERIGVVHLEILPHALRAGLSELFEDSTVHSATDLMDRVRFVKSDAEIARIRQAAELAEAGWRSFVAALVPGAREFEVVAHVEAELKSQGAEDNFMIIASGGSEVRGMTPPTDRALQQGDMVRTELTPQLRGYWAQICRSAVVGDPSEEQLRSFEIFDEATQAGLDAVRPGATAHDVAKAENDVFRTHGLGEYCSSQYTRVRGHGLGLHFDESPAIVEDNHTILEENAVFIVHPNTYTPIAGYHVVGDPVVVTASGYEPLLKTSRQLVGTHGGRT